MALEFILGPAGSGKTAYIMNAVAESIQNGTRKNVIILVPEQASFVYQADLIHKYAPPGIMTVDVLSFQKLAKRMLDQVGGGAAKKIDELGKVLLLRRLIQENPDTYSYFSHAMNRTGYLLKIGDVLQECKRYQVESGTLKTTIQQADLPETLFRAKATELANLYVQYESAIKNIGMDAEEELTTLERMLEGTDLYQDTTFWVDEFYDFTPQEMHILELLMMRAEDIHISLPMDPNTEDLGRKSVFRRQKHLLDRLKASASKNLVEMLPDRIFTGKRFQGAEDLAFLEQDYFLLKNQVYPKIPDHLQLVEGQNRLSEVDSVARKIRTLCREKGYRYSDIGVFARGDQYETILQTVFTDYEIPFFLDHKEAVKQHPLTELLLAFFEICEENWSYQSMFRFLKTELLPFDVDEIDRLENYVLRYGIRGSSWHNDKEWPYGKDENEELVEEVNNLRDRISAPLLKAQKALDGEFTAKTLAKVIYGLFDAFEVPARLQSLCEEAWEGGFLESVQTHQQIWDKVVEIFNQMDYLLGDTLLTLEDFAVLLQSAFDKLDLGLLPTSLDQVFLGALAHSRSSNLKAVFLLGANEGIMPARATENGFFNDLEKERLRELGCPLSPESKDQVYEEQFLIYLGFTRSSEFLQVSYSLSDEEGKALRPSSVIHKLFRKFPRLTLESAQWPPQDVSNLMEYFNHPEKAMGLLGVHLTRPEPKETRLLWASLYNWFQDHPEPLFDQIKESLRHEDKPLECKLTHTELYGDPIRLSVSALERYRQCPYSYFLSYGLRLKERALYQMEAVDIGTFYHKAVEDFSNYLLDHNLSWDALEEEQVIHIMNDVVDALAPGMQNEILLSTGRYRYLSRKLGNTLEKTALMLMDHGKKGNFVPIALEADFGKNDSELDRFDMTLKDGTKLALRGRIDRIEEAVEGNNHYLRVIDFKTGTQGLKLSDIYYGLKIQLLTYLSIARKHYEKNLTPDESLIPAGVLYFFFRSGILPAAGPVDQSTAELMHKTKMRADGLLVADMHALKNGEKALDTGTSTLLPVTLLKSAAPYLDDPDSFETLDDPLSLFGKRNSTVITKDQLDTLTGHVHRLIRSLGEEIHDGTIAMKPCRSGVFNGCMYCNYQAICQIQTYDFYKVSEELVPLSKEEVWEKIDKEERAWIEKGGEV